MKYNKQSGKIGTGVIIALVVVAFMFAVAGVVVMNIYNAMKLGNEKENRIVAIQDNNKNIYANGTNEIMTIAKVPKMYAKDLKEIVTAEIQGKYGDKGSQATIQFLQDRQIPLTPELYKEIPLSIRNFHAKFESAQTTQIEEIREYKTWLGEPIRGMFLGFAGYPKIRLEDFKPVTSDLTEEVYESKRANPLDL